ncbi:MAG TPA: LytTR family DNA-binding domain-containing protein [Bryobacteraceae bacterium]|nr:LytTR family DNA-binding domain-containing protein [Bryobacteraceae bacterium]
MSGPVRTVIVDDEPLARAGLMALLSRDPDTEVVAECGSGSEAVEAIRELRPDLLFLDVQMPGCDGFDVLAQLGAAVPRAIIFVTAYDRYAVKAFEAEALDYLLKPFDDARFARALERGKAVARGRTSPEKRLIVKSAGRVTILKTGEIDWIEAADYYACLHAGGRSHLLRRSLTELEEELASETFCRIHRSAIVNLDRVRELRLDSNGEHEVVLRDGACLRLSRSYREQLQARLKRG